MQRNKPRNKQKSFRVPIPGASPGLYTIDDLALKPKITIYKYSTSEYNVKEVEEIIDFKAIIEDKSYNYWIDIKGFGDVTIFDRLNTQLKVSTLVLEDITSSNHRPKMDEYDADGYLFAVSRFLFLNEDGSLSNEQISYLLFENCLISFQEVYNDCFIPVKKRLELGKGNIRLAGSSYLMYALMDVIVDNYFSLLNFWGEKLDNIEERLFEKPDKRIMYDTQAVKKSLIAIRKVAWPERDKLNDLLRSDTYLVNNVTKTYIKDAYDHCIQIIDFIESLKEIASANIDMNLSIVSNRMNEIMKVLTIISSIFIPLTFIAGIYGMNFSREDPVTGKILQDNMPELYLEHGYLYTILIMLAIAVAQVIYFWRKGWFK